MMQFKGALVKYNFDGPNFRKTLDNQLKILVRKSAAEWLRAAIGRVPVYTGTARGTFVPLGALLRVAFAINPVAFRKGRGPGYGSTQSDFFFTEGADGIYGFNFRQDLDYYLMNDLGVIRNIPSTPWKSMEAAQKAYNETLAAGLHDKLPKLSDFITSSEVTLG